MKLKRLFLILACIAPALFGVTLDNPVAGDNLETRRTKHNANDTALNDEIATLQSQDLARIAGSTYSTVQHLQDLFHSAGHITGGLFTNDLDGTVTVSAGSGLIRATNSKTAEILYTDWAAESGVNVALVDADMNFIYVEYNAGSPQVIATTTKRTDTNTNIYLGSIYRDGTTLHETDGTRSSVGDHALDMIRRMIETAPFARVSGGVIAETGTRNIAVSAGTWWEGLERFTTTALDTAVSGAFHYWYADGIGGWTEIPASTQIDNLQYDDGDGTLGTLSNNQYGVHHVYLSHDDDKHVVYGIDSYSLNAANDAGIPTNTPPHFAENHTRLIGKIIVGKSDSAFTSIQSAFNGKFSLETASDHGGLVGLADDDHTQYQKTADNAITWGDGTAASIVHTYDLVGVDFTMTFGDGELTLGGDLALGGNDVTGVLGLTTTVSTANLFGIYDAVDQSHYLNFVVDSDLTVNRDLKFVTGDADVTLDLADDNADRLFAFDNTANRWEPAVIGSGLSYDGTTLSATGGGAAYDVTLFREFMNDTSGVGGVVFSNSGAGTGTNVLPGDQEVNHPGIVTLETGTTATGNAVSKFADTSAGTFLFGGSWEYTVLLKTDTTLSDITDGYRIEAGMHDAPGSLSIDGIYLEYSDDVNSGKWLGVTESNNTRDTLDTGVLVVADTWYALTITWDGADVTYDVNGTSVTDIAPIAPQSTSDLSVFALIDKQDGITERKTLIDYLKWAFTVTR